MLGASGLAQVLGYVRKSFGIAPGAEVTTESNPESTSPKFFEGLLEAGYTRVSLGMQSASSRVLQVLERRHTPGRPVEAAKEARAAGFEHVNLDMIYGTPGETDDDVRATLEAVLAAEVDHVSAYSLIVEDGTAMARKVRCGELRVTDEDVLASRYALIDGVLSVAGFDWYEVSNWARPTANAATTLAIGATTTGGVQAPAPTPTSAIDASSTSSTPPATPNTAQQGRCPLPKKNT